MKTDFEFEENQSGVSGMCFWIFAAVALFLFLGENPLWGPEVAWAESSREMLVSGDFLHPSVNWQVTFERTPFFCWFMAFFIRLFGNSEWAVRIPAALAAMGGLYGTFSLAQRLFDRKTAVLSFWFLLSCYGFLFWGRLGTADAANMAAFVLAVNGLFSAEEKVSWKKYCLFYLAAFACVLLKGFSSLVILLTFLLPHLLIRKRWLSHLKKRNFAALCLGFFLGAGLFYLALIRPPADVVASSDYDMIQSIWEHIKRECFWNHGKNNAVPFYSYVLYFLTLLLPWAPLFLVCAFVILREKREEDIRIRELLLGTAAVLLLLTVFTPYRQNQTLPLLPFAAIFMAAVIYREGEEKGITYLVTFLRWCGIFVGALALALPVMLPVFKMMFHQSPPLLAVIAVPVAGLVILTVSVLDDEPGNCVEHWTGIPVRMASMTLAMVVIVATFFGVVGPALSVYRTEKKFIQSLTPVLAGIPPKHIAFYQNRSMEPFLYYLQWNTPVVLLEKPEQMRLFLNRSAGEKAAFICRSGYQKRLFRDLAAAGISAADLKIAGKEPGKGEKWLVFLVDVPKNTVVRSLKFSPEIQQNKSGSPQP